MRICSVPGQGTVVALRLPIGHEASREPPSNLFP
jgi:hypothetical protein